MNKRQRKKKLRKELEEEFSYCQGCFKKLDLKRDEYHRQWGTCDQWCYMKMVGLSMSDFL
jgi:hypothetical protein